MIPREILKKIRQIEIRTNRLVTEFAAGARLDGGIQLVFWPALTCVLSPRRGFQPVTLPLCPAVRPANPIAGFSKDAGSVSPSPWGEGRDEGGRETNFISAAPERGCVRSTSRSTPAISNAPTNHHALRLGLRPQPRSNSCRAQGSEFRVYAARFASAPSRLKAELQTLFIRRCRSRITHYASRIAP